MARRKETAHTAWTRTSMESNKDDARKCLELAKKYVADGNMQSARKFCLKSINLFDTPDAQSFLKSLDSIPSTSGSTSGTSTAREQSSSGMHQRGAPAKPTSAQTKEPSTSDKKRDFTPEQKAIVTRVRACRVTAYYEILDVSRTCEEADIKKAYRKLALALHPDKNGAPGSDEAFKMVSKAFQILSDSQKRAIFDRDGSDPDSRSAAASSPFNGFAQTRRGGGPGFQGEVSPEDLFNMFFGGGMAGMGGMGGGQQFHFGGVGGTPIFSASFGGPGGGFRRTNHAPQAANAQQNREGANTNTSVWMQMLPLIILFLFSMLTSFPSLFSSPPLPDPGFDFTPSPPYVDRRFTNPHNVPYYVDASEYARHPKLGPASSTSIATRKFERNVELQYAHRMDRICEASKREKERRIGDVTGFFGFGADWDKVRSIQREVIPECQELHRLGYTRT